MSRLLVMGNVKPLYQDVKPLVPSCAAALFSVFQWGAAFVFAEGSGYVGEVSESYLVCQVDVWLVGGCKQVGKMPDSDV